VSAEVPERELDMVVETRATFIAHLIRKSMTPMVAPLLI
jgi:hypothetical protein